MVSWGSSYCPIRLVGDASLAVSFPLLISRILAKGDAGVSVTSQGLHLIIFLARYLDLMVKPGSSPSSGATWAEWLHNSYAPFMKCYLIGASASVLLALQHAKSQKNNLQTREFKDIWRNVKRFALFVVPLAFLAYRFNYYSMSSTTGYWFREETSGNQGLEHSFGWIKSTLQFFSPSDLFNMGLGELVEIAWAFSIYLSAIADIPQYIKYYSFLTGRDKQDWRLMGSLLATASFRIAYIPHATLRYMNESFFDPITFASAITSVFAFWMFFILSFNKINNQISEQPIDEEANWDEYESGWNGDRVLFNASEDELLPLFNEKSKSFSPSIPIITVVDVDGPTA